ncbi:MAG: hypothetical protein LBT68_02105 [Spirochaetales bacterium]|jgi:hypothetical protein|nr:hypothetical protein [Spirochaetales bacterium]
MKKLILFAIVFGAVTAGSVFAQSVVAEDNFSSIGAWKAAGGSWRAAGSLVQGDKNAPLARINRQLPQSGVYEVDFSIKYAGGGYKDLREAAQGKYHAGFGIHIGVDKAASGVAWGNGKSYLLWVNLDTEVSKNSPHYGFRGQIYQSRTNTDMRLMKDYNVEILPVSTALPLLDGIGEKIVPVKLIINTNDGEIRVYDPTRANYYYYFYLDPKLLKGSWVSLRTNKLSAAFSDFKVTKLR